MNFPLRRIRSIVHISVWIFLVVAGWFLWSIFLFTIIGTYQEFFVYHRFQTYLKSFIPVTVGLSISDS